jgi:replicative DNA helicase
MAEPTTNIEAEQAVLGAVLLDNAAFPKAREVIEERSFYREAHRKIFSGMRELIDSDEPIDLLTLTDRLRKNACLEQVGGQVYLSTLVDAIPSSVGVKQHAKLVKEASDSRDLQRAMDEAKDQLSHDQKPEEIASRLKPVLDEISESRLGWGPPMPIENVAGPSFPIEALPVCIRDFVLEVSEARQVPVDLPGVLALGSLSACVGGKAKIEINPSYSEPLNIFVASVLGPGTRKSAVFADTVSPIEDWETDQAERMRPLVIEAEEQRQIEEERLRQLRKKASKEADPGLRQALVEEAAEISESLSDLLRFPRIIADDVTPERLAGLLAEHAGRISVMSAEGGIFGTMAGRYSSSGESHFDVFLKGHAGDPLRVDRIGRPPEYVRSPALTLALAIQPEVLRMAADHVEFRRRGLLARFLFSIPEDRVGHRLYREGGINPNAKSSYEARIRALLDLPTPDDPSAIPVLRLDHDAIVEWVRFHDETESAQGQGGALRPIRDWASKLSGAVARIAGLLHLAELAKEPRPWEIPVNIETMLCAVALGEYFRDHAMLAFRLMGEDPVVETAQEILAWIARHCGSEFTLRDLYQHHRGSKKPDDLLPSLSFLESRGYLRRLPDPKRNGPGRPSSPKFIVNPNMPTQNTQKSQNPADSPNFVNSVISV